MDLKLFLSTFILIAVAELPDKTAFATMVMATKNNHWSIFIGVCSAFLIQSLVAVTFGSALSYFPEHYVRLLSGLMFFVFAYISLREKVEEPREDNLPAEIQTKFSWKGTWSSFLVIFVAEWGDITQLATASLQAKYKSPLTIFCAATSALWLITAVAIFVGIKAKRFLEPVLLNRIAAGAFTLVGLFFVVGALRSIFNF